MCSLFVSWILTPFFFISRPTHNPFIWGNISYFLFCRGFISGISTVGKYTFAGSIMLFLGLFFSILAVLEIVLLIRVCTKEKTTVAKEILSILIYMYLKYYYRTALTNDVSIALFITNWYFNRGWINGFSTVGKSNGAGAFMLIMAFFFSAIAVFKIILLIRVILFENDSS